MDYGNLYTDITPAVVTEHTLWARPYSRPTPRLLWIMALECGSNNARLVTELQQRLGGEYAVSLAYSAQTLGSDTAGDAYWSQIATTHETAVREDLATKSASPWEVLLLDTVAWDTLPKIVRDIIVSRVRGGAGLVFTSPQPEPFPPDLAALLADPMETPTALRAAFPADRLATFALSSPLLEAHACGAGRIAVLRQQDAWPEDTEATGLVGRWADPVVINFEYYLSLLCLAVIWAGRREPDVTIVELTPDAETRWPYAGTLNLQIASTAPDIRALTVEIIFRDTRNRRQTGPRQPLTISPGLCQQSVLLGDLRPGRHFIDIWLRDADDRVVCWASTYLEVAPEVAIASMRLDRERYERDEAITAILDFAQPPPVGSTLSVSLFDNYGRLLEQHSPPIVPDAPMAFALTAASVTTPVAYLLYELTADDKLLGCFEQEVLVAQRPPADDFTLAVSLVWEGDISHLACQLLRRRELSKYGVRYAYLWAAPPAAAGAARENQVGIPGALNLGTLVKPDTVSPYPVRQPCLSDPERLEEMERTVRAFTADFRPFGPPFISLGGERFVGQTPHGAPDLCWSASCLAVFREFIREQYDTLEALNRQYGTTCTAWEQVQPGRWADCETSGNYAPWVDHMLAMDRVATRFFTRAARAVQDTDPAVKVGWDSPVGLEWAAPTMRSSFVFQLNYDYLALLHVFSGLVPYDSQVERELIRSLTPDGYYFSEWWGAYLADRYEWWQRSFPWRLITKGANSSWYFHDQGPENALALDLRPTPWFVWANEELQEIRAGVGKLLLHAEVERDGIAVLWTQSGYWAATIGLGAAGRPNRPHGRMMTLLQDLGLSYRYITGEQLAARALRTDDCRLLVLPWAQALSVEEAATIRVFVQEGGIVLADVRPGVLDPHCAVLPAGLLDDVFGLAPCPLDPAGEEERRDDPLPQYERRIPTDASAIYVHRYGQGAALLLNRLIDGYGGSEGGGCPPPGFRVDPESVPFRARLCELLAAHGLMAPVRLEMAGMPQAGVEITRYCLGDAWYLVLLPDKEVPRLEQTAAVSLPKSGHLYDVRRGRYIGETDHFDTVFARGNAQMYALLPYRVDALELDAPETICAGDKMVCNLRVRAHGASITTHVLHLELIDPNGQTAPWCYQNLLVEQGCCSVRLPLALNEAPGAWTLRVRDIATGVSTEQVVTIIR